MEYWVNVVLLFFIFGFAGWCMEVALKYRQYHRFINRGFLTGPILPIYGCGVALIYDEQSASDEMKRLKAEIDRQKGRLENRAFVRHPHGRH